jgi:hypothetical protein
MADATLLASLGYFSGIDNISKPTALTYQQKDTPMGVKAVYPLQVAENVWIDNTMHLQSRTDGQTVRVSGNIHSIWSDGTTFLYMLGDTLYSLDKYYASTALKTGQTYGRRMSYSTFNDRIYFSNGIDIGYIKAKVAYGITTPTVEFKLPLPPGKHIATYRARLYSAAGKVLYISDPLSDCYDTRSGFRYFKDDIVMVRPVENGIYVADTQTWFLKGLAPEEFTRENVEDNSVIPYTDITVDDLKEGTKDGAWAMWTSSEGICIGDGNGNVTELTSHRFTMAEHIQGAAMIRDVSGVSLYINTMRQ